MKSLNTVQEIFKIMHIVIKVLFIIAIVGASVLLACGGILLIVPSLGSEIVSAILSDFDVMGSISLAASACLIEAVFTAGTAVVFGFIAHYLKNELADGTPFTHRGASELLRLGIIALGVPLVANVVAEIIYQTAIQIGNFLDSAQLFSYMPTNDTDGIYPVLLILLSFVFHYGADLLEGKQEAAHDVAEKTDGTTEL